MIDVLALRPNHLKPLDFLPWYGGTVRDVEEARQGGVYLVYLDDDPVPHSIPYFEDVEVHRDVDESVPSGPPAHGIPSSAAIRARMQPDIAEMRDIDDGQIGRDW